MMTETAQLDNPQASVSIGRPRNLSHLAIGVSDMDASIRFYRDVIGLLVAIDRIEEVNRPEFSTRRRGVYLRWAEGDDSTFIVLDQTLDRTGPPNAAKKMFELGIHHYGFWVDDVDAIIERGRAMNCTIVMEPTGETDSSWYGETTTQPIRAALLEDPDGNIVQLDQRC